VTVPSATVFGLDVRAEEPLLLLADTPVAPTGRELELSLAAGDGAKHPWPESAETVCDQRERDGGICFRIEADPVAGYLIWGPAYGRHFLSADGRRALCAPDGLPAQTWQRLLIAQVLPFAAVLRGLEVLHASAVVHEGHTIAFLGPSRAGKTSLALELCRRGATFLADDVLALERAGEELLGHPGAPIAGLDHDEARRLERDGTNGHETIAANDRERLVRMRGAEHPAPLGALLLLERRRDGPSRPHFEPLAGGAPLLAGTFNSVLTTPERLRGLLDICALATRRRVERILLGPDVDASQLAEAVLERLGGQV
jgi:hypothetical protein